MIKTDKTVLAAAQEVIRTQENAPTLPHPDVALALQALQSALRHPRAAVYHAIDGERDYQDALPSDRTDGSRKTVGDYITMLGLYCDHARAAWATTAGNDAALDVMRKCAGIAVRCMEEHGAPERVERVRKPTDPVHFEPAGSWYFWDETWADRYGPFEDEITARRELARYADSLNGTANGEERKVPRPVEPRAYRLGDKVIIPALGIVGEVTHLGRDPVTHVMVEFPEQRYPGTTTAQWFKTEELQPVPAGGSHRYKPGDKVIVTSRKDARGTVVAVGAKKVMVDYEDPADEKSDSTFLRWFSPENLQPAPVSAHHPAMGCCGHASDCAVHNEPAMPAGECDCGVEAHGEPPHAGSGGTHRVSMDRYGFKNADELDWLDISGEAERAYVYRDGFSFKVTKPLQLAVKRGERGDSHRIRTKDGHGIYVAPGWVAIVWKGLDGTDNTTF